MLLYSLKIGNLPEAMKCLKALIADVPYSNKKLASMDMDVSLPTNIKSTIMKYPIGIQSFEQINREILKGFYSVFKLADKHLQFVLLTGVTKFSQVSVFSGFNQPKDISYDARFDALCGITKDELITVFKDQIKELGDANGITEEQAIAKLKRKYDGYHFSKQKNDIFNPFSILNCFDSMDFRDYWFATGTPTYLMRLWADNHVNINELAGKEYPAAEFVDYKATKQKPLPMLYQSGYFTIKGYNQRL